MKKKRVEQNRKKNLIITMMIVLVTISALYLVINKTTITGLAEHSEVTHCTVSTGKTYSNCMRIYLGKEETTVNGIPWARKTAEKAAEKIKKQLPKAKANPKSRTWIELIDWLEEKIKENTKQALTELNKYAKTNGRKTILIAWTYEISDSWWENWKWIDIYYDYYFEDNYQRLHKYASYNTGFYYNPKTGLVRH